jgi:hypothetical protein
MKTNEVTDLLTEKSMEQHGLSLHELLTVIESLEKLRVLLGEDHLYTQRCIGLARSTSKDDPLDCGFVLRAMKEMLTTNAEDFAEVRRLIGRLAAEER